MDPPNFVIVPVLYEPDQPEPLNADEPDLSAATNNQAATEHAQQDSSASTADSDDVSEANEALNVSAARLFPESFLYEMYPFNWVTLPEDVELGGVPFDLNYLAKYMDGGRDGAIGRAFIELPHGAKVLVAFYTCLPGPRVIRATWSHTHQRWVYLSLRQPNKVPFVVEGFNGAMTGLSTQLFKAAPQLSSYPPYRWFNYAQDTLFLDFTYCIRTEADRVEFDTALWTAIYMLSRRSQSILRPNIKNLRISFCPWSHTPAQIWSEFPSNGRFVGAYNVIVVPHDH